MCVLNNGWELQRLLLLFLKVDFVGVLGGFVQVLFYSTLLLVGGSFFFFGFFDVSQFLLCSSIVMFGTWKRRCFCLVLPFSRKDQPLHVGALATFGMICRTFFFRFPFPTLLCQTVLAMYCLALAVHLLLKKITQQGPRTRNLLFSPLRVGDVFFSS